MRICLLLSVLALASCDQMNSLQSGNDFDWQGHRGARGLAPENSIPAMLKALEYPVTTLEMDVVITRDSQVILSHEPWMSAQICLDPEGQRISEDRQLGHIIYAKTYEEVKAYDCGSLGHEGYPRQEKQPIHKPLLSEVVAAVRQYCMENEREMPKFNIEIKSDKRFDGGYTPKPNEFASLVVAEVKRLDIADLTIIQSFDNRSLQAVRNIDPEIDLAYLTSTRLPFSSQMDLLGFIPEIYSPNYSMLAENSVIQAHKLGMKVIPWTVNDPKAMRSLMEMGVDGIITDFPDLILEVQDVGEPAN